MTSRRCLWRGGSQPQWLQWLGGVVQTYPMCVGVHGWCGQGTERYLWKISWSICGFSHDFPRFSIVFLFAKGVLLNFCKAIKRGATSVRVGGGWEAASGPARVGTSTWCLHILHILHWKWVLVILDILEDHGGWKWGFSILQAVPILSSFVSILWQVLQYLELGHWPGHHAKHREKSMVSFWDVDQTASDCALQYIRI